MQDATIKFLKSEKQISPASKKLKPLTIDRIYENKFSLEFHYPGKLTAACESNIRTIIRLAKLNETLNFADLVELLIKVTKEEREFYIMQLFAELTVAEIFELFCQLLLKEKDDNLFLRGDNVTTLLFNMFAIQDPECIKYFEHTLESELILLQIYVRAIIFEDDSIFEEKKTEYLSRVKVELLQENTKDNNTTLEEEIFEYLSKLKEKIYVDFSTFAETRLKNYLTIMKIVLPSWLSSSFKFIAENFSETETKNASLFFLRFLSYQTSKFWLKKETNKEIYDVCNRLTMKIFQGPLQMMANSMMANSIENSSVYMRHIEKVEAEIDQLNREKNKKTKALYVFSCETPSKEEVEEKREERNNSLKVLQEKINEVKLKKKLYQLCQQHHDDIKSYLNSYNNCESKPFDNTQPFISSPYHMDRASVRQQMIFYITHPECFTVIPQQPIIKAKSQPESLQTPPKFWSLRKSNNMKREQRRSDSYLPIRVREAQLSAPNVPSETKSNIEADFAEVIRDIQQLQVLDQYITGSVSHLIQLTKDYFESVIANFEDYTSNQVNTLLQIIIYVQLKTPPQIEMQCLLFNILGKFMNLNSSMQEKLQAYYLNLQQWFALSDNFIYLKLICHLNPQYAINYVLSLQNNLNEKVFAYIKTEIMFIDAALRTNYAVQLKELEKKLRPENISARRKRDSQNLLQLQDIAQQDLAGELDSAKQQFLKLQNCSVTRPDDNNTKETETPSDLEQKTQSDNRENVILPKKLSLTRSKSVSTKLKEQVSQSAFFKEPQSKDPKEPRSPSGSQKPFLGSAREEAKLNKLNNPFK